MRVEQSEGKEKEGEQIVDNEDDVSAEDPRSRFPWNSTDTIAVEIDEFPTGVGTKITQEKAFEKVRFERKFIGAGQKFGESRPSD